jgi:hypothetical protein
MAEAVQAALPYKLPQSYPEALRMLADTHERLAGENQQTKDLIGELEKGGIPPIEAKQRRGAALA